MKRFVIVLMMLSSVLATIGCSGVVSCGTEPPAEEEPTLDERQEEITPQPGGQEAAIRAYSQIMESIGAVPPHDPTYPGYPEEFGDAYFRDGYLYICLTENTRDMRDAYRALVDNPEILQFKEVEYAYNDLYALQEAAAQIEGLEFSYIGVDVMENQVDIGIPDISKEAETLARIIEKIPAEVAGRFSELPIAFEEEPYATLD